MVSQALGKAKSSVGDDDFDACLFELVDEVGGGLGIGDDGVDHVEFTEGGETERRLNLVWSRQKMIRCADLSIARWISISSAWELVMPSSVIPPALITATSACIPDSDSTASGPTNTPSLG